MTMDEILERYPAPLNTQQLNNLFKEVIEFKENEVAPTTDDLIVEGFERWIGELQYFCGLGFEHTGDAVWHLTENLGIAYVIAGGSVPVSEEAFLDAEQLLETYDHILPVILDRLFQAGFLRVDDSGVDDGTLFVTYAFPECEEGCECGAAQK